VLAKRAGVEWQGVAYKVIGNAWTDLYAGNIQFMFVDLTAGRGQVVATGAAARRHIARAQPALSRPADPGRDLSRLHQHGFSPSPCQRPRPNPFRSA
jgi:hypothetical protein